jgi:hypothetical protein
MTAEQLFAYRQTHDGKDPPRFDKDGRRIVDAKPPARTIDASRPRFISVGAR